MSDKLRIFLVDDHVLVRDGIKALLEEQEEIEVINEASDGDEALRILENETPDLVIADIRMPNMNGIDMIKELKRKSPHIKTLMLSMHDSEEYVVQSIQAGADGYLLKGSSKEEFLKALHKIMNGEKYFSGDISTILINHFSGKDGDTSKKPGKPSERNDPFRLTRREKQILDLVLEGKSNKEIGEELNISKRTTEVHRFNLMKKLEVKNLAELTKKVKEHNL
ncbi:response regulator transcription factor [Sinomicrobium sp. M5D2P17]